MKISDDPEKQELFDRLLWLRNHYEMGRPSVKADVLRKVDEILDRFRKTLSAKVVPPMPFPVFTLRENETHYMTYHRAFKDGWDVAIKSCREVVPPCAHEHADGDKG